MNQTTPAAIRTVAHWTAVSLWCGAALLAGIIIATQPLSITLALTGIAGSILLALITPLAALAALLILAPLRTLIATESPIQLPLDIGQLALISTVGIWLTYRVSRRQSLLPVVWSSVYAPVLAFFTAGTLTAFSAFSLAAWLTEWLKWAQILLLITFVLNFAAGQQWQWLVFGLVASALANALVGIYEFFGGSGALHLLVNDRFFRAFGTFGQPNPFGGFMGLIAPVALMTSLGYSSRLWQQWQQQRRIDLTAFISAWFYLIASACLILGLVMSWGRGAWLGFGISALALVFALPRKFRHSLWLLLVASTFLILVWSSGRLPASIADRIASVTEEVFNLDDVRGVDISTENYALVERLAHWQAALNMAREHPWLGVGLGNYEIAYPQYRLSNWKFPLGHAHNYYLNVLAEAGIIGLGSYIVLWVSVIWLTWRAREHPDPLARCVVVGLLGTWTYLTVHSLTDNLYVNNLFIHLGVMLGILALLHGQTYSSRIQRFS